MKQENEIPISILVAGISHENSKNKVNFSEILHHFQTSFSDLSIPNSRLEILWQPNKQEIVIPGKFKYYLTWIYSYYLFFASSKKRFVMLRTLGATTYFMFRKILGFDSETSGRSSREYMYLDQLLTTKHFQAFGTFLDSNFDSMLVVCDDVTISPTEQFVFADMIRIIKQNPKNYGIFIELAPFYEQKQLTKDFNYQVRSRVGENWFQTDFFANTAACYLINRNAAEIFMRSAFENPLYRSVSIDWLLTYIGTRETSIKRIHYWTRFPPCYLNSSLYSGRGELVGDESAIVPKSD
jgi:hypothetical protein